MLTRLQVPAGKAIALAAMPTAVLMGMGLTPQLASASPRPEDRYKAGPCVSQPDEADKDAKDTADSKDSAESKDPKGSGDTSGSEGGTPAEKPDPSSSPSTSTPTPEQSPSGSSSDAADDKESAEPSATPSPSESESTNPLDPLGVGDKLRDIFTPDDEESKEPSASPSPSESSKPTPSASPSSEKPADPVKDTVDKVGDGAKDTVDKAKETAEDTKDAADKATSKPSASASESGGKDGEDGKDAFPCPEFDADAYKNAKTDPTSSLLPDDPWTLKSSLLSLHGLDYKGIVEVKTYGGKVKKVLKFTASGVDIKDLHQTVVGPGGTTTHVAAREGSTSTIRNGTVTMYTEELSGNLLGIIPITFSPKSPPPLNLPEVFFTKVTVTQAGQFGGDLTVPGMHLYKTGG